MNCDPIQRGKFDPIKGGTFELWPNKKGEILNFDPITLLKLLISPYLLDLFVNLARYARKYLWGSFYWNTYCIAQFIFIKNVFSRGSIYFQDWLHFRNDVMSILVYTKIEKTHQNLTKNRTQHMHTLDDYFFSVVLLFYKMFCTIENNCWLVWRLYAKNRLVVMWFCSEKFVKRKKVLFLDPRVEAQFSMQNSVFAV